MDAVIFASMNLFMVLGALPRPHHSHRENSFQCLRIAPEKSNLGIEAESKLK